jgi:site-specific DNA-cytosine methylase
MRVQTFPDDFILDGTLQTIRTAIGNAVPPMLSKIFGLYVQNNILAKI